MINYKETTSRSGRNGYQAKSYSSRNISFCLEWLACGRPSTGFEFSYKLFIQISSFLCFFQVSLNFPEFSQIQSSNFLSLFNLFLVRLHLILELVYQFLHPFMIFVAFFLLESQILDTSIETSLILLPINKSTLFLIKLAFPMTKSLLKTLYNFSTS